MEGTMEEKIQQSMIIRQPTDLVRLHPDWIAQKEAELADAEAALKTLAGLGASEWRIERVTKRVRLLRKTVKALQAGFVPIPRFRSEKLTFDIERLPLDVIVAVDEAKSKKVFDEFRIVVGTEADRSLGERRTFRRDPLVVGIVREPDAQRNDASGWMVERAVFEEHFLVAWWRPEDVRAEEEY